MVTKETELEQRHVACSRGLAVGIVGGRLRRLALAGENERGPVVQADEMPAPPGRILSLDAAGPSAILADGRFVTWTGTVWRVLGDLLAP